MCDPIDPNQVLISGGDRGALELLSWVEKLAERTHRPADSIDPIGRGFTNVGALGEVDRIRLDIHLLLVPIFILLALIPIALLIVILFFEVDLFGDEGGCEVALDWQRR